MDIKLRARLSAYSKVDSINIGSNLPDPSISNVGDILGVNSKGDYVLLDTVSNNDIDNLFKAPHEPPTDENLVTNTDIDTLFENLDSPDVPDHPEIDDTALVSYTDIDSLFN